MNTIQAISTALTAIGAIGGGALVLEGRYTAQEAFVRHVAESRAGTILDLVERAERSEGEFHATLCRALRTELAAICQDAPDHAMCMDRESYLRQAGC